MDEREWKILRGVKEAALERLCERILSSCRETMEGGGTWHERYLRVFRTVGEGNDDIAWAFDDLRRSNMLHKLAAMVKLGLVTDEELARFTPKTRESIEMLKSFMR
jgi:hypothetical protein